MRERERKVVECVDMAEHLHAIYGTLMAVYRLSEVENFRFSLVGVYLKRMPPFCECCLSHCERYELWEI